MGTALAGIRTRVEGLEHVPRNQAVVFCANHQSNIDPPILFKRCTGGCIFCSRRN